MPDDFLKVEETVNDLLNELSKIRSANEQIDKLVDELNEESSKIN